MQLCVLVNDQNYLRQMLFVAAVVSALGRLGADLNLGRT